MAFSYVYLVRCTLTMEAAVHCTACTYRNDHQDLDFVFLN
jgi:hypothetical protein